MYGAILISLVYNSINHTHILFKKAMVDVEKDLRDLFDLVLQELEAENLNEEEGEGLPEWKPD